MVLPLYANLVIFANEQGNPPVPIGGKTYGMLGVEYSFGITEDFRLAAFYDGGFVNKNAGDFSLDREKVFQVVEGAPNPVYTGQNRSGWNSNFGFGIRMSMMGTPLRLDYAIPITTDGSPANGGNARQRHHG